MKTQIIIKKGWRIIAQYEYFVAMSKNDVVSFECIEYRVDCMVLDLDDNTMKILLHS